MSTTADLEYTYAYTDDITKIDIYRYKDYDMPLEEVKACIADERHYRCIVGDKAMCLTRAHRYWDITEEDGVLTLTAKNSDSKVIGVVFESFRDKYLLIIDDTRGR